MKETDELRQRYRDGYASLSEAYELGLYDGREAQREQETKRDFWERIVLAYLKEIGVDNKPDYPRASEVADVLLEEWCKRFVATPKKEC